MRWGWVQEGSWTDGWGGEGIGSGKSAEAVLLKCMHGCTKGLYVQSVHYRNGVVDIGWVGFHSAEGGYHI